MYFCTVLTTRPSKSITCLFFIQCLQHSFHGAVHVYFSTVLAAQPSRSSTCVFLYSIDYTAFTEQYMRIFVQC